jgi:hypothetical protein
VKPNCARADDSTPAHAKGKEQEMKRITRMALVLALAGLAGLAILGIPGMLKGDEDSSTLSFDVACDCRTGATLDGGVRGSPFMIQGKIFPSGTLPSGIASNDPTQSVNGVAPIGHWICRGQVAGALPAAVASAYASAPTVLNTQYYILDDGRAATLEGYELPNGGAALSVTGGVGGFTGASGAVQFPPSVTLGTNATGCPNFRAKFHIRPGSLHGAAD